MDLEGEDVTALCKRGAFIFWRQQTRPVLLCPAPDFKHVKRDSDVNVVQSAGLWPK